MVPGMRRLGGVLSKGGLWEGGLCPRDFVLVVLMVVLVVLVQ